MKDAIKYLERDGIEALSRHLRRIRDYEEANQVFEHLSGIVDFLDSPKSYDLLLQCLKPQRVIRETGDRREYGDFQTPNELTDQICSFLVKNQIIPQVVIEPTFGKGSFILSVLRTFQSLEVLFGIEFFEPYCWITKFTTLNHFLKNPSSDKPKINLVQADIFTFDFSQIKKEIEGKKVLILGNPPWVTNAELSSLGSKNLPLKRNIKGHRGFLAITGKSNFDISEYIILMLLDAFASCNGYMALLVKNAVVRNVVHDLRRTQYPLGEIEAFDIDTKKYFGAAVDASLFTCRLGAKKKALSCTTYRTFDRSDQGRTFGWIGEKFAADVETYVKQRDLDGVCPYIWRQGVKHDCSGVLELNSRNGRLVNKSGDHLDIETDLVYGLDLMHN